MSEYEKLKVDHAKLRVLYFQKEAENNELKLKKDGLEDLNKVYLQARTMQDNELAGCRTELTTLKEENARLKTAVARGGGSSEASKNLKTVNTTLMRQNGELKKENGELKKENKDLVKKHSEMAGRVNAFKSTEKKLAVLEVYAKSRDGDFQACKHDFHRMRKMKESLEKELDEAKKAGADTTLAKTLKNLEDKVFSQVGVFECVLFIHPSTNSHRRTTSSRRSGATPRSSTRAPPPRPSSSTSSARRSSACATSSCPSPAACRRRPRSPTRTRAPTPAARSTRTSTGASACVPGGSRTSPAARTSGVPGASESGAGSGLWIREGDFRIDACTHLHLLLYGLNELSLVNLCSQQYLRFA